jgi:N-acylneuraminate cytidylyltransferase
MNRTKKVNVIGFIFARGGSKGVPRKNIKLLNGKPLIVHAIECGQNSTFIKNIIVSTDDPQIAKIASQNGALVPFLRPAELARDDSPEWKAWQHAIIETRRLFGDSFLDIFVSLPATAPLRSVEDVDKCVSKLNESDADIVITVCDAQRHPSFNMVKLDQGGYAHLVMPLQKTICRRQDAPIVYDITTVVYAARPDFILNSSNIFDGKVRTVNVPPERALDIDTELDFQLAEFFLSKRATL